MAAEILCGRAGNFCKPREIKGRKVVSVKWKVLSVTEGGRGRNDSQKDAKVTKGEVRQDGANVD